MSTKNTNINICKDDDNNNQALVLLRLISRNPIEKKAR